MIGMIGDLLVRLCINSSYGKTKNTKRVFYRFTILLKQISKARDGLRSHLRMQQFLQRMFMEIFVEHSLLSPRESRITELSIVEYVLIHTHRESSFQRACSCNALQITMAAAVCYSTRRDALPDRLFGQSLDSHSLGVHREKMQTPKVRQNKKKITTLQSVRETNKRRQI